MHQLEISELDKRHSGVSEGTALAYLEATTICLDRHHVSPASVIISDNAVVSAARVSWSVPGDRLKASWNNQDDATAAGAYCVALAIMELTRGLVALGRAETRTGADYYLGQPGETLEDFEGSLRLEVSGINHGTDAMVRQRLSQKIAQAQRGNSNLPAIAAVVEFSRPGVLSGDVPTK